MAESRMNRNEFMKKLEELLGDIPQTEREEALQYYNEYFNDAGAENEQSVIEALGTPSKVAENIKKDLNGGTAEAYGENAFGKEVLTEGAIVKYREQTAKEGQQEGQGTEEKRRKKLSSGMVTLIVILCILASPMLLGLAGVLIGLIGVLFGVLVSWFALIFSAGITALALIFVFAVMLILGIACMFSDAAAGLAIVGGGMICGGIGILFLMLTVAMAGIATPAILRGIGSFFHWLSGKRKDAAA